MRPKMVIPVLTTFLILAALVACSPAAPATSPPQPSPTVEERCGDGVCDGPENAQTCPQDCTPTVSPPTDTPVPPTAAPQDPCGDGVCDEAEKANPALCPQDCPPAAQPTQEPPTPTSTLPTSTPVPDTPIPKAEATKPGGACGDGICDEMEQKDPNLCPQDCPPATTVAGTPPVSTAGAPDYEPPINVFLVLHIDPLGELGTEIFKPELGMYTRTRDEIDWLMGEAARHDLLFTSLYNGWFPQMALEMGDLSQFEALLAAGHEIGSHAHQITYDPGTDAWVSHQDELSIFGRPDYDPDLARQAWDDASRYVESVLEAVGAIGQNEIMCSTALSLSDERNLMADLGFTIAPGNRLEAGVTYLGHMPWNPWRAANSDEPGHEIAEDLSAPYVSINHGAQIGGAESHDTDVTVPQLQRQFLTLYAEWLARERTGAEDRVWSFGFVYHPNQGDRYNADLAEFLDWLDAYFITEQSPYGHTIARYTMVTEIADEFYAWEAAHPGASSFSYVRGDPYPYTHATVATTLQGAAYEAHVDLGDGVTCFRFSRDGRPIYMLWSDLGERTVDLSVELSRQVRVTSALGEESAQDATALALSEAPVLVQPLE